MFDTYNQQLDKIYRQEQEARAAKIRLAQSVGNSDEQLNNLVKYARNTNIASGTIFVVAIVAIVVFFMSAGINFA